LFVIAVLAAIAIPTFLNQRVKAHTPKIPAQIGSLTRSPDQAAQEQAQKVLESEPNLASPRGAVFVDADGTHQVTVYTAAFRQPAADAELEEFEAGYWKGFRQTAGVQLQTPQATDPGEHGGRVTCAMFSSPAGTGETCVALDAWSMVVTTDQSMAGPPRRGFITTVREAVLP